MADLVKIMDGFARDQNGRLIALPMKLPDCPPIPSSIKKSSEKKRRTIVKRPYIHIEPLPNINFAVNDQPAKPQKLEKPAPPVRKELFKAPNNGSIKKPTNRRLSYLKKKKYDFSKTKVTIQETIVDNGSPLLDVEEVEKLSQTKPLTNIWSKTVLFPKTEIQNQNITKNNHTPVKTSRKDKNLATRDSNSDSEFLELEKALASAKKAPKNDIISSILRLVIEEKEQFEEVKKQFKAYETRHENRINTILHLLEGVTESKENFIRKPNKVVTPVQKKVDLRKKTLTKSLQKSFESESPRTRNAVNMYNTLRSECSVLCTPVIGNKNGVQSNITRSLSKKLQQQCLLLQDTPKQ